MVLLVYIMICLIWGSTWMAIKLGLADAPPLYTAAVRYILAVLVVGLIARFKGYSFPTGWHRKLIVAYPGLYMFGLSYGLVYWAEQYIDSALTAVLFGSLPFFVALISNLIYKTEHLRPLAWGGLMIGLIGAVLITYEQWQTSADLFLGTILVLVSSFSAAYGTVIHKHKHSRENIFVALTLQMGLGGGLLLVAALIVENLADFGLTAVSVGSILYLALLGSVAAFAGYYWLLKRTTAVIVSMTAFVTPMVAIFIGMVLYDESMTLPVVIGSVMILSGIFLVVKKPASVDRAGLSS